MVVDVWSCRWLIELWAFDWKCAHFSQGGGEGELWEKWLADARMNFIGEGEGMMLTGTGGIVLEGNLS